MAAWALGDIGPGAAEALPALRAVLHDADAGARKFASAAVQKIDPDAALPRAA
jgi:hypothetical protein